MLIPIYIILALSCLAQSNYKVTDGQETKFKEKYKLTARLDEKKHILYVETNAQVKIAVLEVFSPEQMAVRKGIEIEKFDQPAKFSFDLNAPKYKDQYAYWLKVSTTDFPYQEILFTRTTKPATNSNKKTTANTPKVEEKTVKQTEIVLTDEERNLFGDEPTIITTNIKCEAGSKKVSEALRKLDGVFKVVIDIKTGKLSLFYSSDGTPYVNIIEEINNAGFDADDKKTTKASGNPCKSVK